MREYLTVMIKENDTTNLGFLTERLNEGYRVDDRIDVGRSTVITLYRRTEEQNVLRDLERPVLTSTGVY